MKEFFKVTRIEDVFSHLSRFETVDTETVSLFEALDRISAETIASDIDLPDFHRSTMDGYAVKASSTFGASESAPAFLNVKGIVKMGTYPDFSVGPGEAAAISTGGMLPDGADSVVMVEHTEKIDDATIEVYKSVAPGQHMIERGEDFSLDQRVIATGQKLRSQEIGVLAAIGRPNALVYRKPMIGIISTGDEVVPLEAFPKPGQVRDVNTYTLHGLIRQSGAIPAPYGIIDDNAEALFDICTTALASCDMVLISGGSSVGSRDYTIEVLSKLPASEILVHGISISPGKPTIIAKSGHKAVFGLPGHIVSSMIVFMIVVKPFIEHIAGKAPDTRSLGARMARLTRNLPSVQGRTDYIRVRLIEDGEKVWAEPILGKSGLINTMLKADGLIEIGIHTEGLDKDDEVSVTLL